MVQETEKLRGDGFIYERPGSRFLWAQYYRNGKLFRDSTKTHNRKEAEKFLRARVEQAKRPEFVGPKENRLMLDDLEKKLEAARAEIVVHGEVLLEIGPEGFPV